MKHTKNRAEERKLFIDTVKLKNGAGDVPDSFYVLHYVHCKWLQGICREIAVFLALQQNPAESKPAGVNYCIPAPAARAENFHSGEIYCTSNFKFL